MKKLILLFTFVLLTGYLIAQETSNDIPDKKERREKSESEREAKLQKQFETYYQVLSSRQFVIEASAVQTSRGNRIILNPNVNFLAVDSATSVLQSGDVQFYRGNGVGGLTLKGEIKKYSISKNDKRKSCSMSITLRSKAGPYIINIQVSSSGSAEALISGVHDYDDFKFIGQFVPLKESNIFKAAEN